MPEPDATVYEMVRPFAWLAVAAFVIGFLGQVLVGSAGSAVAKDRPGIEQEVSGPASDDWNLPHHI